MGQTGSAPPPESDEKDDRGHLNGAQTRAFGHGYRPFQSDWLNSAYLASLLPNSRWQAFADQLSSALAKKIEPQLKYPDRRQVLFELLGERFVSIHFPNEIYDPSILVLSFHLYFLLNV